MNNIFPDRGAERWMYNFARKNHWRVSAWLDLDDLIQEGWLAYYETRKRYPTATEPKHIQALFYLVFRSKIENLVRAKTKQIDSPELDDQEESGMQSVFTKELDSPESRMLLFKMPKEIRAVIALFDSSQHREEMQRPLDRYPDGRRETLNDRFCKLLGLDSNIIDVIGMTREYLMGM
jgi:DNA-directed RNA polymerase specialized sigma24 family protein